MGLDMYLYLEKYESVGRWDDDADQKMKGFYPKELEGFAEENSKRNFLSKQTSYQVGYWRKENAIHNWIVEHCAGGVDDQRKTYLTAEQAKELLQACKEVLTDNSKAKELLPTTDGFFFGSTDYDEWYFEGLEYTVHLLEEVIKFIDKDPNWDIIYEADW